LTGPRPCLRLAGISANRALRWRECSNFRLRPQECARTRAAAEAGFYDMKPGDAWQWRLRHAWRGVRRPVVGRHVRGGLCLATPGIDSAGAASCQRAFGKPEDRLYTYGASVGGLIKKDKLFLYSALERYTFANYGVGSLSLTVPTTAFLTGDFSALLDKTTILGIDSPGQTVYKGAILDPQTGKAFSGNIIPAARTSAVSQKIAATWARAPRKSGLQACWGTADRVVSAIFAAVALHAGG